MLVFMMFDMVCEFVWVYFKLLYIVEVVIWVGDSNEGGVVDVIVGVRNEFVDIICEFVSYE